MGRSSAAVVRRRSWVASRSANSASPAGRLPVPRAARRAAARTPRCRRVPVRVAACRSEPCRRPERRSPAQRVVRRHPRGRPRSGPVPSARCRRRAARLRVPRQAWTAAQRPRAATRTAGRSIAGWRSSRSAISAASRSSASSTSAMRYPRKARLNFASPTSAARTVRSCGQRPPRPIGLELRHRTAAAKGDGEDREDDGDRDEHPKQEGHPPIVPCPTTGRWRAMPLRLGAARVRRRRVRRHGHHQSHTRLVLRPGRDVRHRCGTGRGRRARSPAGADIVDIGGVKAGPGPDVDTAEEIRARCRVRRAGTETASAAGDQRRHLASRGRSRGRSTPAPTCSTTHGAATIPNSPALRRPAVSAWCARTPAGWRRARIRIG